MIINVGIVCDGTTIDRATLRDVRHELFFLSFVLADQVGQVVRDCHVQLIDRTTPEVRASLRQPVEFVHRVQAEKVPIDVGIGQVVSGYVGERAQPLVYVIVLRVVDDVVANRLLVAEERLVVVVRGQIAVDHLCMIPHPDLKIDNGQPRRRYYNRNNNY